MTTRGITTRLGLGLASTMLAAALLLGFQAPDGDTTALTAVARDSRVGAVSTAAPDPGSTSTAAPSAAAGSGSGSTVVDGPVVTTRFGPVQVEISVAGDQIVSVSAIELPTGGHSGRISSRVAPILASEVLSAQSASIDLVSGATYTSSAYQRSLQAALDQAGI